MFGHFFFSPSEPKWKRLDESSWPSAKYHGGVKFDVTYIFKALTELGNENA